MCTMNCYKIIHCLFHFLFQLVRLVANLSIHPEVGPPVARDRDTVEYLLQILGEICGHDCVD